MAMHAPLFDHDRFNRWKDILDRYDSGELTDLKASKLLDELRSEERNKFEKTLKDKNGL